MKVQSEVQGALKVPENALESAQMGLPGVMHIQANLLNCIGNIWPGEGEILKSPSKTAVLTGIWNRGTISKGAWSECPQECYSVCSYSYQLAPEYPACTDAEREISCHLGAEH